MFLKQFSEVAAAAPVMTVVSDSVRPHRWQPNRLLCPWDSPGKNTGVGCHFLLQCMKMKSESEVAQLCLTLSDPMDCSLPGFSVHGILQARVLEQVAIAFSIVKWQCMFILHIFLNRIKIKIILNTQLMNDGHFVSEISKLRGLEYQN